jgi:hypothetical protein|tara:strand:- start:192 stop:446 length:255 start_codon:yes stop_codon:yes gene_type:complete
MTNRWARARTRVRDYVNQIKLERGCEMCGYNEKVSNLQWHHVIPETKYKAIAEIVSEDRSMKKVDAEIEKCICVCKACHGKLEM